MQPREKSTQRNNIEDGTSFCHLSVINQCFFKQTPNFISHYMIMAANHAKRIRMRLRFLNHDQTI